jgi:hypothetical protein
MNLFLIFWVHEEHEQWLRSPLSKRQVAARAVSSGAHLSSPLESDDPTLDVIFFGKFILSKLSWNSVFLCLIVIFYLLKII